jgi:F-type H+-transporting ATPase subunit epsilon
MAMTLHVDIVSAEKEIYSGTAEMVFAPLVTGEVGILPRHAPLIARMKAGEVRVRTGAEELSFYVSGGMLEVQPHVVTVLADTALRARDIDEAAALKAKERAEEALRNRKADIDYAKELAELAEAVAQLRTVQKLRQQARK